MTLAPSVHLSRRLVGSLAFALALAAVLALTWWAYHPGLSGAFLFDDLGSLPKLGATGPVDNWAAFWRYITSGTADPTGRPLALLSFLIDAHNWPANPYPFKVTNVILHLVNGVLLALVLWRLGRALVRIPVVPSPEKQCPRVVIPGLPAGQNPESVWPGAREAGETDSGSALRGVRNDEHGDGRDGVSVDALRASVPSPPAPRPNGEGSRAASPRRLAAPPVASEGGDRVLPSERRRIEGDALFTLDNRGIAIAALFGAGAWLLHPLLVSTTLYIVQREAMLPATFVLVALLGWMASREALAHGHLKRALVGMLLSAWLCTGLAVLSKANGALLPILLLLTEWIVLARQPMPTPRLARTHRRAAAVFLGIPSVLVIAYLLYLLPGSFTAPIDARGWSVGQRLLTEPRVLTDYLRLLFVPHAHSSGLFNDAFPASTGWLHPASTIPCIVLILALIGAGFTLRKRHPAIALALLFYFAAQLMESGWIPLELYFEHRNYLPAMLLFWPIGIALGSAGTLRFLRTAVAAGVLMALAVLTMQRATLWGNAPRQAQVWAAINPDSARAQTSAALYDLQDNRPRLAAARLRLAMPKHTDGLQIPVNLVTAECRLGAVRPATLAAARTALANDRVGGKVAFNWFGDALASVDRHACRGLDYAILQGMLDAAWRNPHWRDYAGLRQNLFHLEGTLDLAQHRPREALQKFDLALKVNPNASSALSQAATLGAAGYPRLGLAHLDYFAGLPPRPESGLGMPRIHAWVLRQQGYWRHEITHLRAQLSASQAGDPRARRE